MASFRKAVAFAMCFALALPPAPLLLESASAQGAAVATAVTGDYFAQQLKNRIEEVNEAINAVPAGMQAVMRELDVRLRALLVEMDQILGNRINETFNRLDLSQQTFLRGVQDTLETSKDALDQIRMKAFRDAQRLLVEADVTAYNTLYSLPCRDKVPRVLLSTPDVVRVSGDDMQLELLGNFLNIGDKPPQVLLDGKSLKVTELDDTTLSFVVPGSELGAKPDSKRVLSFEVTGLRRESATNLLVHCWRSDKEFSSPVRVSFTVLPRIQHSIEVRFTGTMQVKQTVENVIAEHVQLGGSCSTNSPGSYPHRAGQPNVKLANVRISRHSEICGSSIGAPVYTPGVSTEVVVPYHLRGCGRGRLGDCKGRARASYSLSADGIVEQTENLQETTVTRTLFNRGSASFDIPGSSDPARKVAWRARVTTTEGGKQPVVVELTADRQAVSGYSAAPGTNSGVVVVSVPNPVDEP